MKAIRSKRYCTKPLVDELDRFFAREDFDEYVKPYINAGIKNIAIRNTKNEYEIIEVKEFI